MTVIRRTLASSFFGVLGGARWRSHSLYVMARRLNRDAATSAVLREQIRLDFRADESAKVGDIQGEVERKTIAEGRSQVEKARTTEIRKARAAKFGISLILSAATRMPQLPLPPSAATVMSALCSCLEQKTTVHPVLYARGFTTTGLRYFTRGFPNPLTPDTAHTATRHGSLTKSKLSASGLLIPSTVSLHQSLPALRSE